MVCGSALLPVQGRRTSHLVLSSDSPLIFSFGNTGKVVGKVEQERVPPKGPLNDQVPVHV